LRTKTNEKQTPAGIERRARESTIDENMCEPQASDKSPKKRRRRSPNSKIVILYYMAATRVPTLYLYNIYYNIILYRNILEHFSNRGSCLISAINIVYNILGIIMIVFITASALGCYDRAHRWSCKA